MSSKFFESKNHNYRALNFNDPEQDNVNPFEGLSDEEIETFKSVIWKQWDKGIKITFTYMGYDKVNKELIYY